MLYKAMGRVVHGAVFNTGGYVCTDLQEALVCGSSLLSIFSMLNFFGLGDGQDIEGFLNIGVSLRCFYYFQTKEILVGTCVVMWEPVNWFAKQIDGLVPAGCDFYQKVVPKRLWYLICVGVENILQSCVLAKEEVMPGSLPNLALGAWRVSWSALWCAGSPQAWGVLFTLLKVRLSHVKKMPL